MHVIRIATGLAATGLTVMAAASDAPTALLAAAHALPGGAEGPGTADCVFDNGPPLDGFGAPASQEDPVYPFFAEAADDFSARIREGLPDPRQHSG